VVALVIFIVLTFVGIGAAIWLYQQYSILQRAVAANQQAFEQQAASVFQREGWDLSHEVGAEYGFKYDEQAYAQVAQKLNQAAEYEALLALLGWESTNEVQSALDVSPVQDERPDERYSSIAALLGFYEQQYELLTERVRELDAEVAAKQQLIDDKTAALTRTQNELRAEINELDAAYKAALAEHRKQFNDMQDMYEQARALVRECRDNYDRAREQWEASAADLRKEAEAWRNEYLRVTRGEAAGETMTAAGKVLDVEPIHEFAILEGGNDVGREVNQRFVVYSELVSGLRTRKAEVRITEVRNTTSLGVLFNQKEQVLEGDSFVSKEVWDQFHPSARVAEAPAPLPEEQVSPKPAEPAGAGAEAAPPAIPGEEEEEEAEEVGVGTGYEW